MIEYLCLARLLGHPRPAELFLRHLGGGAVRQVQISGFPTQSPAAARAPEILASQRSAPEPPWRDALCAGPTGKLGYFKEQVEPGPCTKREDLFITAP